MAMNTMKNVLGVSGDNALPLTPGMRAINSMLRDRREKVRKMHDASPLGSPVAANSTFGDRPARDIERQSGETAEQVWISTERWIRRATWLVVALAAIVDLGATFTPAGVRFL
jgi:hypothetical protein